MAQIKALLFPIKSILFSISFAKQLWICVTAFSVRIIKGYINYVMVDVPSIQLFLLPPNSLLTLVSIQGSRVMLKV